MFTWRFWRETLERAVKTGAQMTLVAWAADQAVNLFSFDVMVGLGAFGAGVVISVLTSVASLPLGAENSPSAIE